MATVYITGELLNRVHAQINRMREHEITQTCPNHNQSIKVNASQLMSKIMWGDHFHLRSQIPKEWLREAADYRITVIDEQARQHRIDINGLEFFYLKPMKDKYSDPRVECTSAYLHANMQEVGAAEILQRVQDKITAAEIEARWDKISSDIADFLKRCKSLNEAMKLLPSIRMYLPNDIIQRVERKVERRTDRAAKVMDNVPADEITAAAVAARIAGVLPA